MAERPIFVATSTGLAFVRTILVEFAWHPGLAKTRKQKNIRELHNVACNELCIESILEVSSKSQSSVGTQLSAFNLTIETVKRKRTFSVESAYQASKVFRTGGPFTDLLECGPTEAKRDPRLTESGELVQYTFFGEDWPLHPRTMFYDWLYINALAKHPNLVEAITEFSAFTDIEFNPKRMVNCQARSAALFVSLSRRGLLREVLESPARYRELLRMDEASFGNTSRDANLF